VTDRVGVRLDAAFVLATVGAALTPWPWLALFVGASFLVANAVVIDRRTPPEAEP
jgi:hypothetical protein